jgi:hypothetical protein
MGSAVEPILREGLSYPDPEVRFRCRTILPLAISYDLERRLQAFLAGREDKDNPAPAGWAKFKAVAGDTPKAREFFAAMHRFDTEFLTKLDKEPAALGQKVAVRSTQFMQAQNSDYNAVPVAEELALTLLAALEPKVRVNQEAFQYLSMALYSLSSRPRGKYLLKDNVLMRALLAKFLVGGDAPNPYYNFLVIANLELKECTDFVRAYLKDSSGDRLTRSMAIGILGKLGGRAAIPEIMPFLDDKSPMGESHFPNGTTIKTQLRDVALATLVQATDQSLDDYGFPYWKMFGGRNARLNLVQSPTLLGFNDDQSRDAALKKWADWYAKNKDKLAK